MPTGDITIERVQAFKRATRHGYFVRGMKFLLPVIALGVALAMFMSLKFSLMIGDEKLSVGAVEISANDLKMINPKLDGYTDEGGKYSVTAEEALQDVRNTDEIRLNSVKAQLTQVSKDWARVTAPHGLFHVKREVLDLNGDINVTSSNGMKAFLTEANIFVKTQMILSNKPVRVEMLNGTVRSDSMTIETKKRILLFEGRVRVKIKKRTGNAGSKGSIGNSGIR